MKLRFTTGHVVNLGDGKSFSYEPGSEHIFEGMVNETYGRKYILRGWAVEVPDALDHDGDGKMGGSKPAAPGDETMTAAALLAAVNADPPMQFFTFKAEAAKILGADTPGRKDDIIAALELRAEEDAKAAEASAST